MDFTGKVRGQHELAATLRQLAKSPKASSVDKAMRLALDPLLKSVEMNARAHRQPGPRPKGGHLDEGFKVVTKGGRGSNREARLGAATPRAIRIAHLVELGTAPHFQPRRRGGILHPGARPRRFMTRAFEDGQDKVLEDFEEFIWRLIGEEIAKMPSVRRGRGGSRR